MATVQYIKLDFDKIDQKRLFQGKGKRYLDLVCIPSPNSQYGDTHFVTQSATKEERDRGVKLPILGNVKEAGQRRQSAPAAQPKQTENTDEDAPW